MSKEFRSPEAVERAIEENKRGAGMDNHPLPQLAVKEMVVITPLRTDLLFQQGEV